MTAPPLEKYDMAWLESLAALVEEGSPGVTPTGPGAAAPDRAGSGVMPKDGRLRVQYRFWLDAMKDADLELGQEILALKKMRKFQKTVKDALRLIIDLRAGRIDVLLELFPWVKDAIIRENMR